MRISAHSIHLQPHLARGLFGLGDTTVPVNIAPGTTVQMSPADAAAFWGTNQKQVGPYGGYTGGGGMVTPASGGSKLTPFGSYTPAVMQAIASSPTLASEMPATPQNLAPPGYTPDPPQYEKETTALGPAITDVLTLDSFLQQLLSEMTSMGPQSSAAAGGRTTIDQNAQSYCAATGVDCSQLPSLVDKYGTWFENWAGQTLVPGITPSGVTMTWSGASPQPGTIYPGGAPSGSLPGETLNYGPGGEAGGLPGLYTQGGYVDPATGLLLANQFSSPGGYGGGGASMLAPGGQIAFPGGAGSGIPGTPGGQLVKLSAGTKLPSGALVPAIGASPLMGSGVSAGGSIGSSIGTLLTQTSIGGIPNWVWFAGAAGLLFFLARGRR
jgi:hypothetical protein